MKKNQKTEGGVKIRKKGWLYGILGASVVLFAAVIVFIVLAVNGAFANKTPSVDNGDNPSADAGNQGGAPDAGGEENPDDVNTGATTSFVNPLDAMIVLTEQGFFHNSTLNCYYEHAGIDVSAAAGSEVYAVCDGVIESVYTGDVLNGTQIVLDNGDGVKTVYNYVEPVETLRVGDMVKQGQVIATVAEPTGGEYKSGAHLHLEMYVNDVLADPANYLTFSEK